MSAPDTPNSYYRGGNRMFDPAIIRLVVSQLLLDFFILALIPIKTPKKKNYFIVGLGILAIIFINAVIITVFGLMEFYVRFYPLTLLVPYFIFLSFFVVYKGGRLLFAIMIVESFGNFAISNGILVSYLFYGQDAPLADTLARVFTLAILFPVLMRFVRPQYARMAKSLNKIWAILNVILIIAYVAAYFIAFFPTSIMDRPIYFIHLYIVLALTITIYVVLYKLFEEIEAKSEAQNEKSILALQVRALANQSADIASNEEKLAILRHDMRHRLRMVGEEIHKGNLEEAQKFLENCDHELAATARKTYCKNSAVNAAVTYYFGMAENERISLDYTLDIPENLPIPEDELAVVFANAIENAINSCVKIGDVSLRRISVKSKVVANQFVLEIGNSCNELVKFNLAGLPMTTLEGHGIGTASLTAFAKKHKAIMNYAQEGDWFRFNLLINI